MRNRPGVTVASADQHLIRGRHAAISLKVSKSLHVIPASAAVHTSGAPLNYLEMLLKHVLLSHINPEHM
ncbi:hypothetical protein A0H81_08596 [Grifola frondosa]|uniref:Uncharacterized protein n=1 Tax=Grifola frondosa TaxID=5627 RepID=A0A1C7M360_GRIFR|nr:hypothetical protein A0H81_08596 [Grifola frondosa]